MNDYGVEARTLEEIIGVEIYDGALRDRKGFRPDQIGVEDPEIWREIFHALGKSVLGTFERMGKVFNAAVEARVQTWVLSYAANEVKRLEKERGEARDAAIEEAAAFVADGKSRIFSAEFNEHVDAMAAAIRALKSKT